LPLTSLYGQIGEIGNLSSKDTILFNFCLNLLNIFLFSAFIPAWSWFESYCRNSIDPCRFPDSRFYLYNYGGQNYFTNIFFYVFFKKCLVLKIVYLVYRKKSQSTADFNSSVHSLRGSVMYGFSESGI
jgi:hypothetical protein